MEPNPETPNTPPADEPSRKRMGRRRIKIITDPAKFRRHQRKKMYKALSQYVVYVLIFLALCVFIWYALHLVGGGQAPAPQ